MISNKSKSMKYLHEKGYVLMPLNGKIPINKGWTNLTYNSNINELKLSGNYGIVLQLYDLIIDYDPRNDKKGDSLLRLIKDFDLPETLRVQTGGGGTHLYYNKTHENIRKKDSNYPGIDFLSKGSQVVGPGSIHPETRKEYLINNLRPVISVPARLLEYLGKNKYNTVVKEDKFDNSSCSIEKYINYLNKCPEAIEGQNGDEQTIKVAQRGKLHGLTEEKAYELMSEYYNSRCFPAWDESDLRTKVRNAYKYSDNIPAGILDQTNDFQVQECNNKPAAILNIIKGISKVNEAEDFAWIVKNLFAKKYLSIVFGEPGVGKTWLMLELALSISLGVPLWNGLKVKQSKVLLLEGDCPDNMLKSRLKALNAKYNDENFRYVNRYDSEKNSISLNLSLGDGINNLERIVDMERPDVLIVDTLISFINDEKDPEAIKKVIDKLRLFADNYNCHILICHHSRKRLGGEKRTSLDQSDVIGSSVITRLASIVIGVEKNLKKAIGSETAGVVSVKKGWFEEQDAFEFTIKSYINDDFNECVNICYQSHSLQLNKTQEIMRDIKKYVMENHLLQFTRKEVTETLLHTETSIKKALSKLLDEGYIEAKGNTKNRVFSVTQNFEPNGNKIQMELEKDLVSCIEPNSKVNAERIFQ